MLAPSKNQMFVKQQMCGYAERQGSGSKWCELRQLWDRGTNVTRSKRARAAAKCKHGLGYKGPLGSKVERIGIFVSSGKYKGPLGSKVEHIGIVAHSGKDVVAGLRATINNACQYPSRCVAKQGNDVPCTWSESLRG